MKTRMIVIGMSLVVAIASASSYALQGSSPVASDQPIQIQDATTDHSDVTIEPSVYTPAEAVQGAPEPPSTVNQASEQVATQSAPSEPETLPEQPAAPVVPITTISIEKIYELVVGERQNVTCRYHLSDGTYRDIFAGSRSTGAGVVIDIDCPMRSF